MDDAGATPTDDADLDELDLDDDDYDEDEPDDAATQLAALAPKLTDRERNLLRLLSQGFSTATIAERLGVTSQTASKLTRQLLAKINAYLPTQEPITLAGLRRSPNRRGTGERTPRPPGPIDRRIANVAQHVANLKGWSYQDLADRIVPAHQGETWNKPRVQRFLNARKRVTITELADILRALDVSPEWFYQEAGIITLPSSTAGWIEADVHIDADDRRALLRQYERARTARATSDD